MPELICAPTSVPALAAKQATRTVPIVVGTATDVVGLGLVTRLPHPRGNVTGALNRIDSLTPKRDQLLREIPPGVRRLVLLGDPAQSSFDADRKSLLPLASALGMTLLVREASNPVESYASVGKLIAQNVDVCRCQLHAIELDRMVGAFRPESVWRHSRLFARKPPLTTAARYNHQFPVDGIAAPLNGGH
jgi:ABC-type uncharacterized transport system substrate-binding protein